MKIDRMTIEQEQQMLLFREEYRAIGLSTEPADREATECAITEMYTLIGRKKPMYLWFNGQMTSQLAINLILNDQLWDQLGSQLGSQLWDQLGSQLGSQLWSQLGSQLWDQLGSQLGSQLWNQLGSQLGSQLGDTTLKFRGNFFAGQMEAYWIAYYLFPHRHIKPMYTDEQVSKLLLWDILARSCCWWWPYENICICSERPLEIHMQDTRLHRDGGPAFVSRDGWKMWYLHGVRVSREIAETPAEEINPQLLVSEPNVDVRREIFRKVGAENALQKLNAESIDHQVIVLQNNWIQQLFGIDTKEYIYDLYLLDLQDGRRRPFLGMTNPSTGDFHAEGVPPDCTTVEQAIAWRNGMKLGELPEILT